MKTGGTKVPKVSRSAARYARFLAIKDEWPGITFRDFMIDEAAKHRPQFKCFMSVHGDGLVCLDLSELAKPGEDV